MLKFLQELISLEEWIYYDNIQDKNYLRLTCTFYDNVHSPCDIHLLIENELKQNNNMIEINYKRYTHHYIRQVEQRPKMSYPVDRILSIKINNGNCIEAQFRCPLD